MSDNAARMHPLSLRFADAGLEAAFAEEQARKAARPLRMACLLGTVAAVFFWLLSHIFPPTEGRAGLAEALLHEVAPAFK
jgi:hypothetical protein